MSTSHSRRLTLDLPVTPSSENEVDEVALAARVRLLWILDQVREHAISAGRGAELADMGPEEFLLLMGRHGISPFDYDDDELEQELGFR